MRKYLNAAESGEQVVIDRHGVEFSLAPLATPAQKGSPRVPSERSLGGRILEGVVDDQPDEGELIHVPPKDDFLGGLPTAPAEPVVDRSESQELDYCEHGNVVGYCRKCE